jgi:hypothetical protein
MKRSLWGVMFVGGIGIGVAAVAQDALEAELSQPPAGGEAAAQAADSEFDRAAGVEQPADPAFDPALDPSADRAFDEPFDPAAEPAQPLEPGVVDPAAPGVVPPGEPPAGRPPVAQPPVREPGRPETVLPDRGRPGALPPADPAVEPGVVEPGVVDPLAPEVDPQSPEVDPLADPLARPIERQPLPPEAQPLPPQPGVVVPPAPGRRVLRQPIDPAYGAPAPPVVQPAIPIDDVVRNPIRVYEARLLVLMGHWPAAEEAVQTLSQRFPTDARVPYLRYFLLSRTGQPEAALDALRHGAALERLYPITDYNRFMEPIQGADRFYLERVRRAAAELAALDGLAAPEAEELLPYELQDRVPADERRTPPQPVPADPGV